MKLLPQVIRFLGGIGLLVMDITREIKTKPFYWRLMVKQIYEIGYRSLPIVFVTGACTGMVLPLQFGLTLEKFGAKIYSPNLLSLAIFRELGPVFTSLILAGRVGASLTAEIGAMKVTQQIDALLALGTSPVKRIVIPSFLGGLIAIPLLCLFFCCVCIFFGALVGALELNLDILYFLHKVITTTTINDFLSGYMKAFFFAAFIILTSCYFGFQTDKGTYEVGNATTKAVVYSSVMIVFGDYVLTKIYWLFVSMV